MHATNAEGVWKERIDCRHFGKTQVMITVGPMVGPKLKYVMRKTRVHNSAPSTHSAADSSKKIQKFIYCIQITRRCFVIVSDFSELPFTLLRQLLSIFQSLRDITIPCLAVSGRLVECPNNFSKKGCNSFIVLRYQ
jgi:hypothetical protein